MNVVVRHIEHNDWRITRCSHMNTSQCMFISMFYTYKPIYIYKRLNSMLSTKCRVQKHSNCQLNAPPKRNDLRRRLKCLTSVLCEEVKSRLVVTENSVWLHKLTDIQFTMADHIADVCRPGFFQLQRLRCIRQMPAASKTLVHRLDSVLFL